MSVFKEHYEKIAVAGGFVLLAALTVSAVLNVPATSTFIGANSGHGSATPSKASSLQERISEAKKSIGVEHKVAASTLGVKNKRPLFMFKSIPLMGRKGSTEALDILDEGANQVHEGINNAVWMKNGLEDLMVYENAPQADPDEDGFTVEEELKAGTNPNSKTSYPEPLSKLEGVAVNVHTFTLKFSTGNGNSIYLKVKDSVGVNEEEELAINAVGFNLKNEDAKRYNQRYKYVGKTEKKADGFKQAVITLYDVKNDNKIVEFARSETRKEEDRAVDLQLNALGQNSNTKRVAVGEKFSLPFGKARKAYQVESIEPSAEGANYDVKIVKLPKTSKSVRKTIRLPKK